MTEPSAEARKRAEDIVFDHPAADCRCEYLAGSWAPDGPCGPCQRLMDAVAHALAAKDAEVAEARRQRDEARANADFLRESIGECHLMISRDSPDFQMKQEWNSTDLPPRLGSIMRKVAALEADLAAMRGALDGLVEVALLMSNAYQPSAGNDWLSSVEWHRALDAAEAALASSPGAVFPVNNSVACVNCKQPVPVTALNAIRCEACGAAHRARLSAPEVVSFAVSRVIEECASLFALEQALRESMAPQDMPRRVEVALAALDHRRKCGPVVVSVAAWLAWTREARELIESNPVDSMHEEHSCGSVCPLCEWLAAARALLARAPEGVRP